MPESAGYLISRLKYTCGTSSDGHPDADQFGRDILLNFLPSTRKFCEAQLPLAFSIKS
jgi:hypothetical protein